MVCLADIGAIRALRYWHPTDESNLQSSGQPRRSMVARSVNLPKEPATPHRHNLNHSRIKTGS